MVSHTQQNSTNPWMSRVFALTSPNPGYGQSYSTEHRLVKEICRVQKFEETHVSNQGERFGVYSYKVETLMTTHFSGLIIWGLIILVTKC
jgi:hypothetical protein